MTSLSRRPHSRILAGLFVGALVSATSEATAARGGSSLFQTLKGYWSGAGKVVDSKGKSESIRCKMSYALSADQTNLNQSLVCASASYKFDVAGSLLNTNGTVSGQWTEKTRGVSGQITGTVKGNKLDTNVSGMGFSAALSVLMSGRMQRVLIRPQGADVTEISIALRR